MHAQSVVLTALKLATVRSNETSSSPIYASCVKQLEYLHATINGAIPVDRKKLRTIMSGNYGMREFEETDPVFAKALKDAQLIASNMADGLKVT
jgi:hypothetical protein